jgi:hypothetical protein
MPSSLTSPGRHTQPSRPHTDRPKRGLLSDERGNSPPSPKPSQGLPLTPVAPKVTPGAVHPALRVGIVVTPNFTLNALANFVDVLRLASDDGDRSRAIRCQWNLMSATGTSIRASCGFDVTPTSSLIVDVQYSAT